MPTVPSFSFYDKAFAARRHKERSGASDAKSCRSERNSVAEDLIVVNV